MRRRLYRFGLGFLIGSLLSYAIFKGRDITGWMPNGRILAILQKIDPQSYSGKINCQLECYGISQKEMDAIYRDGDVDFGESQTRTEPRIYYVNYLDSAGQTIQCTFEIDRLDNAVLTDIQRLGQLKKCPCDTI